MKTLRYQGGVTLNELLVALSVIAILLTLSVPSYSEFITKRSVAGAAELITTFFENAKMESVKRNDYITINYKKSGANWCIGAVSGKDVSCDCMATTPECLIDSVPTVLSNTTYAQFDNLNAAFTDGSVSFDPVRGILTDPSKSVSMQIQDQAESIKVKISVNATGSVRACSPAGEKLVGFQTCI
jgi:type IV fimbrial biogenesis protein FimT